MVVFGEGGALKITGCIWGGCVERHSEGLGLFSILSHLFGGEWGEGEVWHDSWCGDSSLKRAFPELFSIAADKDAAVADYMSVRNGKILWEVVFVRNPPDWEIDSLNSFLELIYSISLNDSGVDQFCWLKNCKKSFTVRSYYHSLTAHASQQFPWKGIWKPKVPTRISFFVWTAVLGKILTNDNLRKRRVVLVNWCCLRKNDGESIDHLFIHCSLAKQLWDMFLTLFGVHWVMPQKLQDLIACWTGALGRRSLAEIWKVIPHCLMWSIWRERNLRTFEGREFSPLDLQSFFFRMLFDWIQVIGLFSFCSFHDFIDSCTSHYLLP